MNASASSSDIHPLTDITPAQFIAANRIHVKDGSLFISPYLVVHPRELVAANEPALREKLRLTYSLHAPSFYEAPARAAIGKALSELLPLPEGIAANAEARRNAEIARDLQDRKHPFAAIVRDTLHKPEPEPRELALRQQTLGLYLLLREKLSRAGFTERLDHYVARAQTADQVLDALAPKLGVAPLAVRQALLQGGVPRLGAALGLDDAYVREALEVSAMAAARDFSDNLIQSWYQGRQALGASATIAQKIAAGLEARISHTVQELRSKTPNPDVAPAAKLQQQQVGEALALIAPVQRALMYALGYEIAYTPDMNADEIAKYRRIYGLHRKTSDDPRDLRGTYRIFFAGREGLEESRRTFVHEVAHNLWPERFSAPETQQIDALAAADAQRFTTFERLIDTRFDEFKQQLVAYQKASPEKQPQILADTNRRFAAFGLQAEGLFPYLRDAEDFRFAVRYACESLRTDGERYQKGSYHTPQSRFREVISRFAELKQVRYRGEPQFLQFLAPGLNQIWEAHYLPHLSRQMQVIAQQQQDAALTPATPAGLVLQPGDAALPRTPHRSEGTAVPPSSAVDAGSIDPQALRALTPATLPAISQ